MAGYSVTYTVVDNATKQIDAINRRIAQTRAPLDRMSKQMARFVDVSGLRKIATGFEWIGKAAGSVLRTLTSIVPVMGAITGAASLAGMVKLVSSYADWSRELVAAADNIGTTTQKLQQFEDATRLAGGNAADMRDSLKGLHDRLADFNRGGANAAVTGQWANKLGINLRDANGHIRAAADLMPELIKRIGELPDPADRAAASAALLGAGGDKLVETFRQSSKSFADWFNDVKRYKDLTDEQKKSLQLFSEAQGRVGVAFDRLGQQISAMVARDLGPLLEKFAVFVEKHTPAILAAVDDISKRFATWLEKPETVAAFTEGVKALVDSLKWVITHLDTIKTAAEVIAGLFVLKWGVDVVKAIGAVTEAIGASASIAGGAAGAGLLGALAGVAAIVGLLALGSAYETPATRAAREKNRKDQGTTAPSNMPTSDYWIDAQGRKHDATTGALIDEAAPAARPPGAIQKQSAGGGYLPGGATPAAFHPGGVAAAGLAGGSEFWDSMARAVTKGFEDAFDHITGTGGMGGGGGAGGGYAPGVSPAAYHPGGGGFGPAGGSPRQAGGVAPPSAPGATGSLSAALGISTEQYDAFRGSISKVESGGRYGIMGGSSGRFAGKYQMGADEIRETAARLGVPAPTREQFLSDPSMQEKFFENYTLDHHNTLMRNAKYAAMSPADKAAALGYAHNQGAGGASKWINSGVAGRDAFNTSGTAYSKAIKDSLGRTPVAAAPPVTVPPPAPVNGSVDVSITHKNPPPNSAVTASGSGSVNVAPPRVEHQDMLSI